ncbi:hypothetical protein FSO04_16965 [Paraburkholderia madseniana]|jgi:hypothetical protein|uniref:Uncharacterized protein n=1 Tax=Paraburkholderia madseniana TaxID=2599607 RepID=A0A6N6WDR9_9BURK|nr:hypothetical protein [Paraburkholderia madseniana]KAE8758755.1 hypothetical protein FSO04_16965 [Paraburkholderia madseniana]
MDEIVQFQENVWTGLSNVATEMFHCSRRHAALQHGTVIAYIDLISATA